MPARRDQTEPLGVVYTPPALARAMVKGLLEPLLKGRTAREMLKLRVCDPAMGEGAFLVEVVQYLAERVVRASVREGTNPLEEAGKTPDVATKSAADVANRPCTMQEAIRRISLLNIVGLDIDPASVEKTVERLGALGGRKLPPAYTTSLRQGDALSFDWLNTFPPFDAVIANPPYIRQESLAGEAIQKRDLRRWRTYDGVADVYVYFIELAHGLLRKGGRYAVLAPNKWMTAEYARPLRSFLAKQKSVDAIVDLSAMKVFDSADAFPCVLFGTAGSDGAQEIKALKTTSSNSFDAVVEANSHVLWSERVTNAGDGRVIEIDDDERDDGQRDDDERDDGQRGDGARHDATRGDATRGDGSIEATYVGADYIGSTESLAARSATSAPRTVDIVSIDRARLDDGPWHIDSIEDAALLARMKRECTTLGALIGTRWSRGVVTGCNDAFIVDEKTRDALLADRGAPGTIPTAELIRPFVKGRNIRGYVIPRPPQWILLVDRGTPFEALPPAVRAHLEAFRERLEPRPSGVDAKSWDGRKPGAYAWHELQDPVVPLAKSRAPRMLYQDIQTAPLCALDTGGEIVPDTTVWILPARDLVLLAILNSAVYRWIAQRRFPPALNGAVRPKLQYMQQLPIPTVTGALRDAITGCVERRIRHAADGERSVADAELQKLVGEAYALTRKERELIMSSSPHAPNVNERRDSAS